MDKFIIALVAGLIGGGAGAFVTSQLLPPPGDSVGNGNVDASLPADDIRSDIASLRKAIEDRPGPMLSGSASEDGLAAAPAGIDIKALAKALREELDAPMREAVNESVRKAAKEGGLGNMGVEVASRPAKKEVTLDELADELQLSAREMDELRQIRTEMENEVIEILKNEDETLEDVRAELLAAKKDPTKQMTVGMKYFGRVLSKPEKLGKLMSMEGKYKAKMKGAVGEEKARRIDEEYDISDEDSLLDGDWGFGGRVGGR